MRRTCGRSRKRTTVSHIQDVTNNVMDAVNNLAEGTQKLLEFIGTDIADKTGVVVEKANEIKEKAEAARIAADKLQQNVEHFIV